MAEDKGHKPTQKRLVKARKDGKVLKNPVITQACVILVSFWCCYVFISFSWVRIQDLIQFSLVRGFVDLDYIMSQWATLVVQTVALTLGLSAIIAVLVEGFQVGLVIEPSLIAFKMERLNIVPGFIKIFSGLKEVWALALKVLIVGLGLYFYIKDLIQAVPLSFFRPSYEQMPSLLSALCSVVNVGCSLMIVVGVTGYFYRRHKFFKELSMSRDELVREHKEDEGDPQMKHQRKALHEEMVHDTVQRVRKSKVIVVEATDE